jgi:hypothetical protein
MISLNLLFFSTKFLFSPPSLKRYTPTLTREDLIRRSRILVIDDENPPLIEDLRSEGFSVDHDKEGNEISKIYRGIYQMVILDYSGVGKAFGKQQGLDLLREIKRNNPSCYVIAYSSKSLKISQSDFYRLSDATLSKDAGRADMLEKVESSLRDAFDVSRLWTSVLSLANIPDNEKRKYTRKLAIALETNKSDGIMDKLANAVGGKISDTLIGTLTSTIMSLGSKALSGT